jgi:ABC-type spermidine/putrescine transport system, permease component II
VQTLTRFLQKNFGRLWLAAVFLFLYVPLFFLILFSFNSTRQDGVFTGFSTRWYVALLNDSRLVDGFFLSLKVAVITGTLSVILGTFAAFVLVRYLRFPGRSLFSGLVSAPMVMPEVIIGLSLLLLMVAVQHAIGWPERGATTIVLGHTLLGMAYATVVISGALARDGPADRGSGDGPRLQAFAGIFSGDVAEHPALADCGLDADLYLVFRRCGDFRVPVRPGRHDFAAGDFRLRPARRESVDLRRGDDSDSDGFCGYHRLQHHHDPRPGPS